MLLHNAVDVRQSLKLAAYKMHKDQSSITAAGRYSRPRTSAENRRSLVNGCGETNRIVTETRMNNYCREDVSFSHKLFAQSVCQTCYIFMRIVLHTKLALFIIDLKTRNGPRAQCIPVFTRKLFLLRVLCIVEMRNC